MRFNPVQLKTLGVGDTFRKFGVEDCPEVRIVAFRPPPDDMSSYESIKMTLSGNVYTLERLDSPGKTFEITLSVLDEVWQSVPSVRIRRSSPRAWGWVLLMVILMALILAGIAAFAAYGWSQ